MCPLAFSHLKFGLILRSLACLVKSGSSMAVWGGAVGGAVAPACSGPDTAGGVALAAPRPEGTVSVRRRGVSLLRW